MKSGILFFLLVLLPSQTMLGPFHSPSAPHTELLSPLLHTKPSSQTNMATLPYVVPVTESSTVSSTEAGWPQSTTDEDKNIHFTFGTDKVHKRNVLFFKGFESQSSIPPLA